MEGHKHTSIMITYRFWAASSLATSLFITRALPQYSVRQSFLWTATVLFCTQWLVYGIYAVVLYPRFFSPLRHLPGPKEGNNFFTGQWKTLIKEPSGLPMRRWINEIPNDGLIRYLHLFNRDRLLITSPKALSEVLVTKNYDFVKPDFVARGIGRILGVGVLLAEGDDHKMQRKNLAPAFNFRHVKALYPIFWSKSREMVRTIEERVRSAPNEPVEIGEWASRATLDIIGVAGLGQDFNSLADPNTELNKVYRRIFHPSRTGQILGLLQFFLPAWILQNLPVKHNENVGAAAQVAKDTSRQLIRMKKERLDKGQKVSPDIISVALESGGFTEEELVNNMMTFLAAGHETTASAMTWASYMLCKHPEVQTKLREEVRAHISNLTDEINDTLIDGMPYLHAFCQEILRFYAPVPLTLRDTNVDTTILGQFVPRGTKVILCPWAINFSKELWGPDAEDFNPERWMKPGQANSGGAESNFAFMTFLHGPRSCIGSKFAVGELACLVAAFVGNFELELTDPNEVIEIKGGITARPRNGMRLNLKIAEDW